MNKRNNKKGNMLVTYLFPNENIGENIKNEHTMKNELARLALSWKEKGLISRFMVVPDDCIKAMYNGKNEWIPCEKKLPQLNQEVRIKFNNGLEFQGGIDEKGWYVGTEGLMFDWFDTICLPDDITEIVAWKPM